MVEGVQNTSLSLVVWFIFGFDRWHSSQTFLTRVMVKISTCARTPIFLSATLPVAQNCFINFVAFSCWDMGFWLCRRWISLKYLSWLNLPACISSLWSVIHFYRPYLDKAAKEKYDPGILLHSVHTGLSFCVPQIGCFQNIGSVDVFRENKEWANSHLKWSVFLMWPLGHSPTHMTWPIPKCLWLWPCLKIHRPPGNIRRKANYVSGTY